ncbi:MAG: putative Na+/H+ antiporter [Gemmatimonadales bacterium]
MSRWHLKKPAWAIVALSALLSCSLLPAAAAASGGGHDAVERIEFPPPLQGYDDGTRPVVERLTHRVEEFPFNLVGTLLFLLAIAHTFLTPRFRSLSHRMEVAHERKIAAGEAPRISVSHWARFFHFLGEVEVVFGLWCVPLLWAIVFMFDWSTAVGYVAHNVDYTEAMFVVVIMTLASTRPILRLSESLMARIARAFGGTLTAWWLTILTLGPMLGSLITEPATMTICALLLARKFYELEPSRSLKYATLGLLFVNISVGGTLTHFAAPPVLMVAEPWGWGLSHMLLHFGWKAALGIAVSNGIYWFVFRGELGRLQQAFHVRAVEEDVLEAHFPREHAEQALKAAVAAVQTDRDSLGAEIQLQIESFAAQVKERLWQDIQQDIQKLDAEPEVVQRAFERRYQQIKLARFREDYPHVLPKEQRAPFLDPAWDERDDRVPPWVVLAHVVFMVWTIVNAHEPALFVAGVLFFLGFASVTADFQNRIDLKAPLLVGFFLGGLVTLGGLQGWWIEPVLGSLAPLPLSIVTVALTAFNDNAAITYLATLVPDFNEALEYAAVAGAVTGGGLTVIANAPNPAGQSILNKYFENGIAPLGLLKAALGPTLVMFAAFALFA